MTQASSPAPDDAASLSGDAALLPLPRDMPLHLIQAELAQLARQQAEATEREAEAEAERAAAQAAAAAEAEAALAGEVSDAILAGEPPDDLDVDTEGLPPRRARLARFVAWRAKLQADLENMESGRVKFLKAVGAPAETEAKIKRLIEADRTGFLAWIKGGAAPDLEPKTRAYEREQLAKRLGDDLHRKEIALASFDQLDRDIDLRKREIAALDERHDGFVQDALLGHADETLAATYVAQIAALRETTEALFGLSVVVRGRRGFRTGYAGDEAEVGLPVFDLPSLPWHRGETVRLDAPRRPELKVTAQQARDAAEPWRDLARLWREDPRADPPCHPSTPSNGDAP